MAYFVEVKSVNNIAKAITELLISQLPRDVYQNTSGVNQKAFHDFGEVLKKHEIKVDITCRQSGNAVILGEWLVEVHDQPETVTELQRLLAETIGCPVVGRGSNETEMHRLELLGVVTREDKSPEPMVNRDVMVGEFVIIGDLTICASGLSIEPERSRMRTQFNAAVKEAYDARYA